MARSYLIKLDPELGMIRAKLAQLAEELIDHLAEEEQVVFPMIGKLERNAAQSRSSVGNPVALLIQDHENAGVLLAEMRSLSRDYTVPAYACSTYRAFYEGLTDFELDLHRHVHLENNILFPRATPCSIELLC